MLVYCYVVLFVPCSLEIISCERDDLLCVVFLVCSLFVTIPYGVPGQVWYLIAMIPINVSFCYFVMRKVLFAIQNNMKGTIFKSFQQVVMYLIIFGPN